jgi:hypothetical protein
LDSLSLSSSAGGAGAATGQRVAAYRLKRRLQRRRRRLVVAFLSIVAAVVGVAYYQCQVLEPHHPMCATVQQEAVELWKDIVSGGEYKKALAAEKASKARALLVEQEEQLQLQQEQAQAEAAERARLAALEEAEHLAREKAEELERQRQKALMLRPWACNLPFSYLFHSRCRRLATLNPVFDLYGLVQSMLQ